MVTVVTSRVTAGPPVLLNDTLPASGSDVVGGQITFAAVFDGSRPLTYQWQFQDPSGNPPVDIPNATNTTLTISSLHLADAGNYFVTASNAWGTLPSTSAFFAVNPLPAATNNIVVTYANQTGLGGANRFTPNWLIASNSLIAGAAPSSVGPGDFSRSAAGELLERCISLRGSSASSAVAADRPHPDEEDTEGSESEECDQDQEPMPEL